MDQSHPQELRSPEGEKTLAGAIRELILGASDGIVSTLGLVTGVAAGTVDSAIVVLAGVAGAVSGAISMGTSSYLGVKSQIEVLKRKLEEEESSIREHPQHERAELVDYYRSRGLSPEEIRVIVPAVERNKDFLMEEMAAHELGISKQQLTAPVWKGVWTFLAFVVAAAIPIIPYAIFARESALPVSIIASVVALFLIGFVKTRFTGRNPVRSGLEMLAIAVAAGAAGFIVGTLIAPQGF